MDLTLTLEELEFRDALRDWLGKHLPEHKAKTPPSTGRRGEHVEHLRAWQRTMFDGGWAGVAWPKGFGGRGASVMQQAIFQQEMAAADAPERLNTIGEGLVGPTIIAIGTTAQKERFLRPMLEGKDIWCQGFSEPNSGSDLASLTTKGVRDGDQFVVNGQKIWTSYAHIADWCMLLVRTDAAAPKHKGITCLLVDMKSPGVSVRPLKMMSGDAGFNEVFFDDVRVPAENMLGKENDGWRTAILALSNERANLGSAVYVVFKRNLEALVARIRETNRGGRALADDPLVRQRLAQATIELEIFRLNTLRALSVVNKTGSPGPEGSIQKLYWSEMNQRIAQMAVDMLGPDALLSDFDGGRWAYNLLRSRGNTIEAGTSEVQRNILAERVLGLPKRY